MGFPLSNVFVASCAILELRTHGPSCWQLHSEPAVFCQVSMNIHITIFRHAMAHGTISWCVVANWHSMMVNSALFRVLVLLHSKHGELQPFVFFWERCRFIFGMSSLRKFAFTWRTKASDNSCSCGPRHCAPQKEDAFLARRRCWTGPERISESWLLEYCFELVPSAERLPCHGLWQGLCALSLLHNGNSSVVVSWELTSGLS